MTNQHNKKSLSLKSHRPIKPKQKGTSALSNTVKIQIKRKKVLSEKGDVLIQSNVSKNSPIETNRSRPSSQSQHVQAKQTFQPNQLKEEKIDNTRNKKKPRPRVWAFQFYD